MDFSVPRAGREQRMAPILRAQGSRIRGRGERVLRKHGEHEGKGSVC